MSSSRTFKGHKCNWCKGTKDEHMTYASHHDMIRHAEQAHYTNGIPHHNTFLNEVDRPNDDPSDVTDPVVATLMISVHNCTTERMLMIEPPAGESVSKSKRENPYELLRDQNGNVVLGPRGDELYNVPGLGRTVSSTVHDFFIEYIHFMNPKMNAKHIRDRQKRPVQESAYNQARGRYRERNSKNFVIRSVVEKSKGTIDRTILSQLDGLTQGQLDHNTFGEVVYKPDGSSEVTLPRPKNIHPDEIWNPSPIISSHRRTPHRYTPWMNHVLDVFSQRKELARQLGKKSWQNLSNEQLQLGKYVAEEPKDEKLLGNLYEGKFIRAPEPAQCKPKPDTAKRGPDIEHDELGILPGPRLYYKHTRPILHHMLLERDLKANQRSSKPDLVNMLVDDDERREREGLSPVPEPEVSKPQNRKRKITQTGGNEEEAEASKKKNQKRKPAQSMSVADTSANHTPSASLSDPRERSRIAFETDFPDGYETISTPHTNLECGLYAIRSSIEHQGRNLRVPSIEELRRIATTGVIRDRINEIELALEGEQHDNDFLVDHLGGVLQEYARLEGQNVRLGIHGENGFPGIMFGSDAPLDTYIIWIHNDNAEDDNVQGGRLVILNHYSGMKRKEKQSNNRQQSRLRLQGHQQVARTNSQQYMNGGSYGSQNPFELQQNTGHHRPQQQSTWNSFSPMLSRSDVPTNPWHMPPLQAGTVSQPINQGYGYPPNAGSMVNAFNQGMYAAPGNRPSSYGESVLPRGTASGYGNSYSESEPGMMVPPRQSRPGHGSEAGREYQVGNSNGPRSHAAARSNGMAPRGDEMARFRNRVPRGTSNMMHRGNGGHGFLPDAIPFASVYRDIPNSRPSGLEDIVPRGAALSYRDLPDGSNTIAPPNPEQYLAQMGNHSSVASREAGNLSLRSSNESHDHAPNHATNVQPPQAGNTYRNNNGVHGNASSNTSNLREWNIMLPRTNNHNGHTSSNTPGVMAPRRTGNMLHQSNNDAYGHTQYNGPNIPVSNREALSPPRSTSRNGNSHLPTQPSTMPPPSLEQSSLQMSNHSRIASNNREHRNASLVLDPRETSNIMHQNNEVHGSFRHNTPNAQASSQGSLPPLQNAPRYGNSYIPTPPSTMQPPSRQNSSNERAVVSSTNSHSGAHDNSHQDANRVPRPSNQQPSAEMGTANGSRSPNLLNRVVPTQGAPNAHVQNETDPPEASIPEKPDDLDPWFRKALESLPGIRYPHLGP